MSSDGEEVRWNRDHGWTENPDAATNWDNYEERHYTLEELINPGIQGVSTGLENASGELMSIDVDPQDRVWYISRGEDFPAQGDAVCQIGYIEPPYSSDALTDPGNALDDPTSVADNSGDPTTALELDVIVGGNEHADSGQATPSRELGGQSIAIDPDFEENGYVYVFYSPASDDFDTWENPYNEDIVTMLHNISRFEFDGEVLDPDSEEVIIQIPKQLHNCCHIGGYLQFGPDGCLYITSGNDCNNVGNPDRPQIDYSMTDEREGDVHGRPAAVADAQRTSQNTADLRGSVLRITPEEDGSYSIPEGNLKEYWEEETGEEYTDEEFRPELYVMGLRNPFVVSADEHTGFLFVADYAGGAPEWHHDKGAVGVGTYHLFDEPGNAGYPYFKGYYPNRLHDFENGVWRQPAWPDNLRNESRNNTGIENIPNATPAIVWDPRNVNNYTDAAAWADVPRPGEITWPQFDASGGSTETGIAYRYWDQFGEAALDPYFDGKQFITNPENSDRILFMTYNEDGAIEIDEFLPDNAISRAHDMAVLSDGRLAVMGMSSGVHVIEYQGDPPEETSQEVAEASATPSN